MSYCARWAIARQAPHRNLTGTSKKRAGPPQTFEILEKRKMLEIDEPDQKVYINYVWSCLTAVRHIMFDIIMTGRSRERRSLLAQMPNSASSFGVRTRVLRETFLSLWYFCFLISHFSLCVRFIPPHGLWTSSTLQSGTESVLRISSTILVGSMKRPLEISNATEGSPNHPNSIRTWRSL